MKCWNCGETSRIREKDKFCHKCGANLKEAEKEAFVGEAETSLITANNRNLLKVGNSCIELDDYTLTSCGDGDSVLTAIIRCKISILQFKAEDKAFSIREERCFIPKGEGG